MTNSLKFNEQLTNGQNFNWQLTFVVPHPDTLRVVRVNNKITCEKLIIILTAKTLCHRTALPPNGQLDKFINNLHYMCLNFASKI